MILYEAEITEDEKIEEMKECYATFDTVGDMKVEHFLIIDVLRSLGLNPLCEDVNKLLEDSHLIDTRVDFEEFYQIHEQIAQIPIRGSFGDIVEGLATMDHEQCGLVKSAELSLVLQNIGNRMTQAQVKLITEPHMHDSKYVIYKDMIRRVLAG